MKGNVTELGYIVLHVSDISVWKEFASRVIGLEVVEGSDPNRATLRADYWHYRVVLILSPEDDIAVAGWRVAHSSDLDAMKNRLEKAGIPYEVGGENELAERQVLGLIKLVDPCGLAIEVFFGPRVDEHNPIYPGRRMHRGFVTGVRGLGHIVLNTPDTAASEAFYVDIFGMVGSVEFDHAFPDGRQLVLTMMSCNPREHSVAFASNLGSPKRLGHLMLEYEAIEDVGMARDILKDQGHPILMDIGQHANDRVVSVYFPTPSGWMLELGSGGGEPRPQAEWNPQDVWGHEILMAPPGAKED